MTRVVRRRGSTALLPAAVLAGMVLAGTLAACGSTSTSATGTSAAAPLSTAASPSASGAGSSASQDSGVAAGSSATQFCAVVKEQRAVLTGSEMGKLLGNGSPAAWKAYLQKAAAANQQLVDVAPPEIRSTVESVRQTSVALNAALEAAGYDPSKVGSAKLVQIVTAPERVAATRKLTSYVKTTCGIDLATVAAG